MKVYRVQLCFSLLLDFKRYFLSENMGPYANYQSQYSTENGYASRSLRGSIARCPEPSDDGIVHRHGTMYGFASPFQFSMWFESDIIGLHDAGFKVFEYEVPEEDIDFGYFQVQFDPLNAVLTNMYTTREVQLMAERHPQYWENVEAYFEFLEG